MAAQWGNVLYWMATIIATLLVAWVVWSYVYNSSRGEPIIQMFPLRSHAIRGAVLIPRLLS